MSRSRASTGPAAASSRSSPAAADSSDEPGSEHEAALHVAGHEPVVLERDGQPVGGRSGEAGARDETGEGGRSGLERREHEGGFVEHPDSARVVHTLIMPSHNMDCKSIRRGPEGQPERHATGSGRASAQSRNRRSGRAGRRRHGQDPEREGVGRARRPERTRRAGPALHRPPPDPRGDLAAGVRRAAAGRPRGTSSRPDAGHRGPQRPHRRLGQADRRPGLAHPGRDAAPQRRGVRRAAAPARRRGAGHRAHHRPAARAHPARHDDRVRRLAHLARTAPSARSRSASAPARSSTCSRPRR